MPDGNPLASLYPQPPAQPQNALTGDPLKTISSVLGIQGQQLQQEHTKAAIQALGIANTTALFQQRQSQLQAVRDQIGSIADKPNLSMEDINDQALRTARTMGVPGEIINSVRDTLPRDPAGLRQAAQTMRNLSIGSAGVAGRDTGPPDASGAPSTIPRGAANYAGSVTTGTPPGSEASAGLMQADAARAGNFGQEIFPWQQALQKIQALGPGGTGPGTKGRQDFESFLYAASPSIAGMLGVDPKKIQNYAEAEKYLTQATQQRAAGFGSHTDMQLATALSGSPNVHINDLATTDVTKAAIALRRMEHAQYVQNSGPQVIDPVTGKPAVGGPINYSTNKAKWAASQDPRAYALDLMSPAQVAALDKSLKGQERAKFNASLKAAQDSGVITSPQSNASQ